MDIYHWYQSFFKVTLSLQSLEVDHLTLQKMKKMIKSIHTSGLCKSPSNNPQSSSHLKSFPVTHTLSCARTHTHTQLQKSLKLPLAYIFLISKLSALLWNFSTRTHCCRRWWMVGSKNMRPVHVVFGYKQRSASVQCRVGVCRGSA